jgi:hypothetical protein
MSIDRTSRYVRTERTSVILGDGEMAELLALRDIPRTDGVFYATPDATDRLDLLAYRYYRDPMKFWRICDAAPEMDPFDVMAPGERLLIPPNK